MMIVDDDELIVYLQALALKESGITSKPVIAYTGNEALEYIEDISKNDHYILLFLDINIPDISGWQILDKINEWELSERVYVVIVTSSVNLSDKKKARTYDNVIHFLEKPIKAKDFVEVKYLEPLSGYFT